MPCSTLAGSGQSEKGISQDTVWGPNCARKVLDEPSEKLVESMYHDACEEIVWSITYAIEHRLPLPRLKA